MSVSRKRSALAKFRACWHIMRGRRVLYGVRISGGQWNDEGWRAPMVLVDCDFLPEFSINGTPAVELRDRRGDVRVEGRPTARGTFL